MAARPLCALCGRLLFESPTCRTFDGGCRGDGGVQATVVYAPGGSLQKVPWRNTFLRYSAVVPSVFRVVMFLGARRSHAR